MKEAKTQPGALLSLGNGGMNGQAADFNGKANEGYPVRIPASLIDDGTFAKLGPFAVTVYVVLLKHASAQTGKCWPSVERLAALTGISVRRIPKAIADLEAAGLVIKCAESDHRSNTYMVQTTYARRADHSARRADTCMHGVPTDLCTTCRHDPAPRAEEQLANGTSTRELQPIEHSLRASFDRFFLVFPNKAKKDEAWKAWLKLSPDAETADAIIASVDAFKASGQWDETRYAGHAHNFIREGKWKSPPKAIARKGAGTARRFEFQEGA